MPQPEYKAPMRRLKDNYAVIASTLALVVALTGAGAMASGVLVGSKQIKNGSVKSVDLKNNGVQSTDIKNDGVGSPDLEPGAVESEALDLPGPVQCQVTGSSKINPTMAFAKVADVCSYTKETAESALEVSWSGTVEGHNGGEVSGCIFQLRVNGQPSAQGGGEAFGRGLAPISDSALFSGLSAGPVTVEVWARLAAQEPGMGGDYDSCTVGPARAGTNQTVVVTEQVV